MMTQKFGLDTRKRIEDMARQKRRRRIVEDWGPAPALGVPSSQWRKRFA
jgi:hypothetical protein